jgi:hypothetical protein
VGGDGDASTGTHSGSEAQNCSNCGQHCVVIVDIRGLGLVIFRKGL